jgi:uncharacterized protein YndB with AHSA1/START domain
MITKTPVKIRVTRLFTATAERVFDAWLKPEMIGTWMFGPAVREEEVIGIAMDSRVGGSFSFVVRRQGEEIPRANPRPGRPRPAVDCVCSRQVL